MAGWATGNFLVLTETGRVGLPGTLFSQKMLAKFILLQQ
jgi:hypothetical protein